MTKEEFVSNVKIHKDYIKRYASKLCNFDRDQAEDLIQDTNLKCLSYLDTYVDEKGYFKSWYFTVMKNMSVDRYRKSSKTPICSDISYQENSMDLSCVTVNNFDTKMLEDFIKSYPNKTHSEIFFKIIDGYKYKELADEYDVPEGTVKG